LAEELGLDDATGVIVTDVAPDGPAAEAGIVRGDVIIELDREAITNIEDLASKLDDAKDSVLVLVRRGANTLFVPLKRAG
jgi:serine protease Do